MREKTEDERCVLDTTPKPDPVIAAGKIAIWSAFGLALVSVALMATGIPNYIPSGWLSWLFLILAFGPALGAILWTVIAFIALCLCMMAGIKGPEAEGDKLFLFPAVQVKPISKREGVFCFLAWWTLVFFVVFYVIPRVLSGRPD